MIKLDETNKVIVAGNDQIPIGNVPDLIRQHLRMYRGTTELELDGSKLSKSYFEPEKLRKFIKDVCYWGGYSGVSARVIRGNSIERIQVHLANALDILSSDQPDVGEALEEVIKIKGLSISFGSKHLRFLRPDICSILDSIISNELGYSLSSFGYKKYSIDCIEVARYLEREAVVNPMNREGKWFASDIDMVVFTYLDQW